MIGFLHSSWAFLVVILFIITLIKYIYALINKKIFDFNTDFRLASFTLIVLYFQIVLGFITWFTSDYFQGIKQGHFGEYMKHAHDRLLVIEHPVMMLIVLLITRYGFKRMKNAGSSQKKYISIILTYGISFLLILLRIPWNIWF
jgi:hypothetical protein